MDPLPDLNMIPEETSSQEEPSGVPPVGASTEQGASRPLGTVVVDALRPLFTALGIDVDKMLEREAKAAEDELAAEPRLMCPICMVSYIRPTAIKACGHVFCGSCIVRALKNKEECPICRTRATKKHLLEIYLS